MKRIIRTKSQVRPPSLFAIHDSKERALGRLMWNGTEVEGRVGGFSGEVELEGMVIVG